MSSILSTHQLHLGWGGAPFRPLLTISQVMLSSAQNPPEAPIIFRAEATVYSVICRCNVNSDPQHPSDLISTPAPLHAHSVPVPLAALLALTTPLGSHLRAFAHACCGVTCRDLVEPFPFVYTICFSSLWHSLVPFSVVFLFALITT